MLMLYVLFQRLTITMLMLLFWIALAVVPVASCLLLS